MGKTGGRKKDNRLPYLRRDAQIMTGHDKAAGCRGTGWVAAGGWSVLFTALWGIISPSHAAASTAQPPGKAHWHGARPFHHAAEQWRMLWFLGNGKWKKTKQHTPEIRSLRCYLPEPLGPVSQLLHLHDFREKGPSVEVKGRLRLVANRAENTDKILSQERAWHPMYTDSFLR